MPKTSNTIETLRSSGLRPTKQRVQLAKFLFDREKTFHFNAEDLHKTIKYKLKIPINKKTRSLNVAMSVAIISTEALRQNNLFQ